MSHRGRIHDTLAQEWGEGREILNDYGCVGGREVEQVELQMQLWHVLFHTVRKGTDEKFVTLILDGT